MVVIWDEVLCKLRVYFDGLVTRKEILSESSHRIDTHLYVVVEVLEIQSSVSFWLCLDEDIIGFW